MNWISFLIGAGSMVIAMAAIFILIIITDLNDTKGD